MQEVSDTADVSMTENLQTKTVGISSLAGTEPEILSHQNLGESERYGKNSFGVLVYMSTSPVCRGAIENFVVIITTKFSMAPLQIL